MALGIEASPAWSKLTAAERDDIRRRIEALSTPYRAAVGAYVEAEVLPFVADAWVDHSKAKVGYEIPLTRQFYRYVPPRPLGEIDAEIRTLENLIQGLLREVTT